MTEQQQSDNKRQYERHEVLIQVGYQAAASFVEQYAHNLSKGGLFVAGAPDLESGTETRLMVRLPGFGEYDLYCRAVHVVRAEDEEEDEDGERSLAAGVGVEIVKAPAGFALAMTRYLSLLRARNRATVLLVDPELTSDLLKTAGYETAQAPAPDKLLTELAQRSDMVVALVAPQHQVQDYQVEMAKVGLGDAVIEWRLGFSLRQLLGQVDQAMATQMASERSSEDDQGRVTQFPWIVEDDEASPETGEFEIEG